MITFTTPSLQRLVLLATVALSFTSATATAQNAPVLFKGDNGHLYKIVVNGQQLRGSLQENKDGHATFRAELQAWTEQQPNGTIVQKEAFVGTFHTTLSSGRRLNGTIEIRPTNRENIIEFRSAHMSEGKLSLTAT